MYVIVSADKGRYDRPIDVGIDETFDSVEEADEFLRDVLVNWMRPYYSDDKLYAKLGFDNEKYDEEITCRIKKGIDKVMKRGDCEIQYNDYSYFQFETTDDLEHLVMITTRCPGDNEYIGETYRALWIRGF